MAIKMLFWPNVNLTIGTEMAHLQFERLRIERLLDPEFPPFLSSAVY